MAKRKQSSKKRKPSAKKQYRRVYLPKFGVDYSALLNGERQIVRLEAKHAPDDWTVRVVETGDEWHLNPKDLETAEPE